jgi:hypothetical protein
MLLMEEKEGEKRKQNVERAAKADANVERAAKANVERAAKAEAVVDAVK